MRRYNKSTFRNKYHLAAVVGLYCCGIFFFGILVFHDGCLFVPHGQRLVEHIIEGLGCGSKGALQT